MRRWIVLLLKLMGALFLFAGAVALFSVILVEEKLVFGILGLVCLLLGAMIFSAKKGCLSEDNKVMWLEKWIKK